MECISFKSGCVLRVENDEMRCQLYLKKAVLAVYIAPKDDFTHPLLLTRRNALLLKMGMSWVAKHLKEEWFIALQ